MQDCKGDTAEGGADVYANDDSNVFASIGPPTKELWEHDGGGLERRVRTFPLHRVGLKFALTLQRLSSWINPSRNAESQDTDLNSDSSA